MSARLRGWCDTLLEGGWLLAVVLVTLYFNIYTKDGRIFEPQKALILRTLVTLMLAVWAIRTLEENRLRLQQVQWWRLIQVGITLFSIVVAVGLFALSLATWQDPLAGMVGSAPPRITVRVMQGLIGAAGTFLVVFGVSIALVGAGYALRNSWKEALTTAMVVPALLYVAVHIVSTIASVFPQASLYGSYVRQQGTLSVLAYIGLFFILAFNLRRREQVERLISVILAVSIPVALYGIVQRLGLDPLPWLNGKEIAVASTMGSAQFLGAYLVIVLPLTGYRLLRAWEGLRNGPPFQEAPAGERGILRPIYPILLGFGIVAILLAVFIGRIMLLDSAMAEMQERGLVLGLAETDLVWPLYMKNLLLFTFVTVATLAPAILYSIPTLLNALLGFRMRAGGRWECFWEGWERWRPYLYLLVLAVVGGIAVTLLLGLANPLAGALGFPERIDSQTDVFLGLGYTSGPSGQAVPVLDTRTNFFVWAGYLTGLLATALLGRLQHAGLPWGGDSSWVDAVYILVVIQSVVLYAVIKVSLPCSVEPGPWPVVSVVALILMLAGFFVLVRRIAGWLGLLLQLGGYALLAALLVIGGILAVPAPPEAGPPYPVEWPLYLARWPLYLIALLLVFATCYVVAAARARGRLGHLAQLGGYLLLGALQVLCVVFANSRGAVLGLLVGAFFFMLLWTLRRRIRWTVAVASVLLAAVAGGILLVVLTMPGSPPGADEMRLLIWFGDDIGKGVLGMVVANPLRALVGYGPETMQVAYDPFYPPELAHLEARSASPDRAFNAIFDELVTMGGLGLLAYLVYLISFFYVAGRLIWKAPDKGTQALGVGLFALGAAQFTEGLWWIPIVATRMYWWIAAGTVVALTAMLRQEVPVVTAAEDEVGETAAFRRPWLGRVGWGLVYVVLLVGAFVLAQRIALRPMQADLLFWKSTQLAAQARSIRERVQSLPAGDVRRQYLDAASQAEEDSLQSLHEAISLVPREDFYFLALAQVYLLNAQQAGNAQQQDLFFRSTEQAITRARDLSFLNTDHYRNFSATYVAWFQLTQQPDKLAKAIAYGEQAISLSPNNADLRNRLARAHVTSSQSDSAVQGEVEPQALAWLHDWEEHHLTAGGRPGDTHLPLAGQCRQQALGTLEAGDRQRGLLLLAAAELHYSLFLDAEYEDTFTLLGDLYWDLGMPAEAALIYADGIRISYALISDSKLEARLQFLKDADELTPLVWAYQDAITQTLKTWENYERLRGSATAAQERDWRKCIGDSYQILGYIHILQGDRTRAISAYEAALEQGSSFESHKNLAILFQQDGQLDQALEHAREALKIAQENNQTEDVQDLEALIAQIQQQQEGP